MERFLEYFVPEYYDLELFVFSEKEYLQGTVKVGGRMTDDVAKFHAVDMDIKEITFSSIDDKGKHTAERICKYKYDGQVLEIKLDEKMKKDLVPAHENNLEENKEKRRLVEFVIKYETKLNHNMQGCYLSTYEFNGQEQKLVATQFESHYAREAFPCIDEPAAKAKFSLTLVIPDRKSIDVVLANTELIKQDINRFEFATTPRMSTYLLAWVIGPLKCVSGVNRHNVKVTSYAALNQTTSSLEFANEVAIRALDYYEDKFGVPYPLTKLDQVALPDFEAGAMENWGLVTYRESCMLAEPNASVDAKQSVAITVTHELSHQWFGDLVTMNWWDDLWLNESFATIMEYYATDALYPELHAWQDFYTGDCVAALRRDCLPGVQAVQQEVHDPAEIATLFDGAIVYAKGARLVLMLITLMGEENFYKGLRDYFRDFKYRNTVGDDLWNKLQPYADFKIKDFMHAWISQPGYPALQESHNGDYTWWAQQRLLIDGTTDDTEWPLPEVRDDMSGHYLIDLGTDELMRKLDHIDELTSEQKLRLLIDQMLLAKAGVASSAPLLELLTKFTDAETAVWGILLDVMIDLKIFFPANSEAADNYHKFLRQLIYDRVREVGMKSSADDDSDQKRLRNILAVIARSAHDEEIIDQLANQYRPNLFDIDAELRSNILIAKVMVSEDEIFSDLLEKYQTENDPELKDDLLCAITSVRHEPNIKTVLSLLDQPEVVRPQDHLFLYIYLLRNSKIRLAALEWLYQHWDYVERLTGEKSLEDYLRCTANYINTRAEADEFYHFFDQYRNNPILKRTLAMAKVSIESKLNLIAKESTLVHNKIKEMVK